MNRKTLHILFVALVPIPLAPPAWGDNGPSLDATMQFINDTTNSGLAIIAHFHDSAKNSDETLEIKRVRHPEIQTAPKAAPCVLLNFDPPLNLHEVDKVVLIPWTQQQLAENPTWILKDVSPPELYEVRVLTKWRADEHQVGVTYTSHRQADGTQSAPQKNIIMGHIQTGIYDFDNQEIAARVSKAFLHAVELCGGGGQDEPFRLDEKERAKLGPSSTSANSSTPQQHQATAQIAAIQSRINTLKEYADGHERDAESFEQQAQVDQGRAAANDRSVAAEERREVQSINREISELQSQIQTIQSQPDNNSDARQNPIPAVRTSAVGGGTAAPTGSVAGSTVVGSAASGCWSSELDEINDPIVRARLGSNRVQQVIQIAQGGGAAALDQQIGLMQQEQEQAQTGIRIANQDIAATAPGGPEASVTPRECADRRQTGNMSAHVAAMCQRLSMQNMLHLATGLIEVMQCVRASVR